MPGRKQEQQFDVPTDPRRRDRWCWIPEDVCVPTDFGDGYDRRPPNLLSKRDEAHRGTIGLRRVAHDDLGRRRADVDSKYRDAHGAFSTATMPIHAISTCGTAGS
jgi:hypothetical protein